MPDLYIYYRVREEHAHQLALQVHAMQAELASEHGVLGQLKRRPQVVDGLQTWMEVYPACVHGFDVALEAAVGAAALSNLIDGQRHTEVFTDLSLCV